MKHFEKCLLNKQKRNLNLVSKMEVLVKMHSALSLGDVIFRIIIDFLKMTIFKDMVKISGVFEKLN